MAGGAARTAAEAPPMDEVIKVETHTPEQRRRRKAVCSGSASAGWQRWRASRPLLYMITLRIPRES